MTGAENPIPPFKEDGLLPEGVYPCDEGAFRSRFVDELDEPEWRLRLYEGLEALRQAVGGIGVAGTQWIDGSFVTAKREPGDIDVVTFFDVEALNGLTEPQQRIVLACLNAQEGTRDSFGCHTFLVPSCAEGHPWFPSFEDRRAYWRRWFGRTRVEQPKGFVSMVLGDPSAAPMIRTEMP